jgi:SSS family solute:Na+ symporter
MIKFINKHFNQKQANLFYSKNESWWLIGFSMLLASGIFVEPMLICASLIKGNLSEMWLYWSATIGTAFSISFFAHLWKNVPVNTENEFIFFRFSGIGAKTLHIFRSVYLGGVIIPFIIAFNLLALSKICSHIIQIETNLVILIITICFLLFSVFNSFKNRIKIDFYLFSIFIILFLILFFSLCFYTNGLSNLSTTIKSKNNGLQILPAISSNALNAFLVFISVQWWSASILDYPDMNGQKLMSSKKINGLVKSVFIPNFILLFFRILLFTLPFMAVYYGFTNGFIDSELAFTSLFTNVLPKWMLVLVVLFFLIPFLAVVQNNQNWAGSLLVENFYKKHINQESNTKIFGVIVMMCVLLIASIIAVNSDSLIGITKLLFTMTAGVGPVFILRWYWWRINAWSQFSAMLAGLSYPFLYDWFFENNNLFHQIIQNFQNKYLIDFYPLKLVVLTILVCITWMIITFLTPVTDENVLKNFASTIKPGGFWKPFHNSGKSYFKYRVLAWILQIAKGFLTYFVFWNFLLGNYYLFTMLLFVIIILFAASYYIVNLANKKYDLNLKN